MSYIRANVEFELNDSGNPYLRQYDDIETAREYMKKLGFDCYKEIGIYEEYVEVIFGKVVKVLGEITESAAEALIQ